MAVRAVRVSSFSFWMYEFLTFLLLSLFDQIVCAAPHEASVLLFVSVLPSSLSVDGCVVNNLQT